jgi:Cu/Zn superoxide dismutase
MSRPEDQPEEKTKAGIPGSALSATKHFRLFHNANHTYSGSRALVKADLPLHTVLCF